MKRIALIFLTILLIGCTQDTTVGRVVHGNMAEIDRIQTEQVDIVNRIFDGDTFETETREIVRMICIDTPEKGEPYYEKAKLFLENEVLDKQVVLVKDVSERDKYNRLLRYVYTEDKFINGRMVELGYARVDRHEPDTRLCDDLEELEAIARENMVGIWTEE